MPKEDSLAKDVHREAPPLLDQLRATRWLVNLDINVQMIAATFMAKPTIAKQRPRLVWVSVTLCDASAEDHVALE